MPPPSVSKLKQWTQAIREMGYPFASIDEATVALLKVRSIKTYIADLDNLMTLITNQEENILSFNFNQWQCAGNTWAYFVNIYLRSGDLKMGCQFLGIITNISPFSERTLKVYLQNVTPEYYTQNLQYRIAIAKNMYPELIQTPQDGATLSKDLGNETKKIIETGLKKVFEKYPKKSLISGIYSCINSDSSINIYDRIVESMQQRSGCYLLHNDYGRLTSCKLKNRTCKDPFTRGCRCSDIQLANAGPSNITAFMKYLINNKDDPKVAELLIKLNTNLTIKLVDEQSLTQILQNVSDATAVYNFQINEYNSTNPEPFSPCTELNSTNTYIACDPGERSTSRNTAINNLDTNYAIQYLEQTSTILDTLVDLSFGTGIDFLYLDVVSPICPENSYKRKYSKLTWFFVILIILLILGLVWFIYSLSSINRKNYLKNADSTKNSDSSTIILVQ